MSTFSDEMAGVALDLLTEFGEAVSFTRTTEGAYNPATGSTAAGSDSVFTGFGYPDDYTNNEIDGVMVQQGDSRLYVNAVSTAPLPQDAVTVDSVVYRVMFARKYSINSENVLYELQIRV